MTELQDHLMGVLKPGVLCSDIYAKALSFIEKKKPELKDHFVKNCGFSMGLEFRESMFVLNAKCQRPLKANMIINLSLGFQNLEVSGESNPKKKTYALLLADTVLVQSDGAIALTQSDKDLGSISYAMGDNEDEADTGSNQENIKTEKKKKSSRSEAPVLSKRTAILDSRRRDDTDKASEEEKRRNHQKLLAKLKQDEGLARFKKGGEAEKVEQRPVIRKFESYRKDAQLPRGIFELKVRLLSEKMIRLGSS